ncbi:hypothetical protein VNO77_02784 [Canavalia gladiata]|uniref:Uncharacterized protein n=1 Tax=Canavalia gladiata TaxID=3824 RepID=A0AAN9R6E3_CANGL
MLETKNQKYPSLSPTSLLNSHRFCLFTFPLLLEVESVPSALAPSLAPHHQELISCTINTLWMRTMKLVRMTQDRWICMAMITVDRHVYVKKLVYDLSHLHELLSWSFNWKYMIGELVPYKRSHILKMDHHKYVKVAYHGFIGLSKEDRVSTYGNTSVCDSVDEPDHALIGTLFSLAEAYLFAQLVDFKDCDPGKIKRGLILLAYTEMFEL